MGQNNELVESTGIASKGVAIITSTILSLGLINIGIESFSKRNQEHQQRMMNDEHYRNDYEMKQEEINKRTYDAFMKWKYFVR